ncbi:MAG TPA: hypothetical protein PLC80_08675 [Draconibacterium sp.]|nr:hypothetical protein [Draconibacterium sp.]
MKVLTIFLFAIISFSVFGQDKIIKKTGAVIEAKVSEIAVDEVKYYYSENPKLVFGIDKVLVEKIEFSTGEVIVMEDNSFKNPEYYVKQNKHALKINFLSPLMGSSEFVYEQSIKPGRSWETAVGIIGLGFDTQDNNAGGVYGKFAYKFIKDPDFYMQRMHYSHILKGAYFAPELALRYVKFDSYNYYYSNYNYSESREREIGFGIAVLLKFGKQWVLDDSFLIDSFFGLGYGIGGSEYETLNYGFIAGEGDLPIAVTAGLRIGWLF